MPKHFPPEIKTRALELYIIGDKSAREISEQLFDEFTTEIKPSTIYLWARQNEWDVEKKEVEDKAFEAAKALDMGIIGERQIMEGMIYLQFVQNVLSVLVEEISDEALLRTLAQRLRSLIQTQEPTLQ